MRNEIVVDVQAVRKSMQQHESWTTAWKVPDIKASASVRNPMLGESWKGRGLRGSGAFCGNAHDSSLQFLGLRGPAFRRVTGIVDQNVDSLSHRHTSRMKDSTDLSSRTGRN